MPIFRRLRSEWIWLAFLMLFLSLHFWFPAIGPGEANDTYSAAPAGKKAFYLLSKRRLRSVNRFRGSLSRLDQLWGEFVTLCLLGPARSPTDEEWDELLAWVGSGGSLTIAVRDGAEFSIESLGIRVVRKSDKTKPSPKTDQEEPKPKGITTPLVSNSNLVWNSTGEFDLSDMPTEFGAPDVLLEKDGKPQAIRLSYENGSLVLLASDFIFTNESLASGDNSVLAFRLLEAGGPSDVIYFDESLNATGMPKVVGILLDPVLRPMTVQLLIGLAAFGWWRSRRFGPLLPPITRPHHNIVDHTDAVGILQYRSGDGARAVGIFLRELIADLRLRQFKGREEQILRPIASRMGTDAAALRETFIQARRAARAGRLERKVAAEFIRRLAVIRRAAFYSGDLSGPKYSPPR